MFGTCRTSSSCRTRGCVLKSGASLFLPFFFSGWCSLSFSFEHQIAPPNKHIIIKQTIKTKRSMRHPCTPPPPPPKKKTKKQKQQHKKQHKPGTLPPPPPKEKKTHTHTKKTTTQTQHKKSHRNNHIDPCGTSRKARIQAGQAQCPPSEEDGVEAQLERLKEAARRLKFGMAGGGGRL